VALAGEARPSVAIHNSVAKTNPSGRTIEGQAAGTGFRPRRPRVLIRDSKHPEQGHQRFTRSQVAAFLVACSAGELDSLV
jgi:hypothetical protein